MSLHLPMDGDAALRAFPASFDERQRPKCGRWNEHFGPCICGDPANHEPGGRLDVDVDAADDDDD